MPKLSPLEKKARKEAKKAENERKAVLLLRTQKHDHISRETKYGQLTYKQHEKNWRQMLINIALPRMREDLVFAWHNFERTIDAKDFIMSLLMDEMLDAEEQYMTNFRCHCENIDILIIKFKDRLDELRLSSDNDLDKMQSQAEKEVEQLKNNSIESEEYFKTMLFTLEVAKREQEKLVRGDYLSKIDEETSKYNDIIQKLRAGLEKRLNNVWDKTKTFLMEYTDARTDRQKAYKIISYQDESLRNLCAEQLIKLTKMQESVKKLKIEFNNLQEIQSQKITGLIKERQYFANAFLILKSRLELDKTIDDNNLESLTVKSNLARTHLREIYEKGKKLLELATVCRKYETRQEKILPFPVMGLQELGTVTNIKIPEYRNLCDLQLFWQHVAQADAVRYSINEEREYLKRENRLLKFKIHEYCQCLDCPSIALDGSKNNLCKMINVVDGNFMQKNQSKMQKK